MALKISISAASCPYGIELPSAYVRIFRAVQVEKSVDLVVMVYASESAYHAGSQPIWTRSYTWNDGTFDPVSPENLKTSAYGWLETLPEYSGAEDC